MKPFTKAQLAKISQFHRRFGKATFKPYLIDGEVFAEYHCNILCRTWYINRKGVIFNSYFDPMDLRKIPLLPPVK